MNDPVVRIEKIDRVAVITINNPPANAFSKEVKEALRESIQKARNDDDIWTLVITGQGDKIFMAGADIPKLLDLDQDGGMNRALKTRELFEVLTHCEKPLIAAINGYCLGGGLELALCCDVRIAADHCRFGLPEVTLGLIPGAGGTQRLPRLIGSGWASYLILSGQAIKAELALEIGLVQDVVPFAELRDRFLKLADTINRQGPLAVRAAKLCIREGSQMPLDTALGLENKLFSEVCATEDKTEGVRAFLEKRKPAFSGR